VLDTGVDASHPDLAGAVLPGFNVIADNTDSSDVEGHGTSVAGVIAARSNNTAGVAGICWTCSILPVKVLGDDGTGDMATLATGIVRAADAGARVINMSLGGPAGSATLDQAIAYAVAKNAVLVAAAGNNGVETPFYPAANPNVISVAATDENDQLYSWSNRGTWVNVTAPGCDPATAPGARYVNFCGTSAAAPVVAGLVALTVSLQPTAARADVMRAITESTDPLQSRPGRIDAPKSLSAIAPRKLTSWSLRGSVGTSPASRTHKRVVAAGDVTATLTFDRGARATLTVADPSGRVLAAKTGASPVTVTKRLGAGTYSFSVRSKTSSKISYTLAVVSRP
jgi:subtilisin family serine protease